MVKKTGFKNPTNITPPQKTGTDYGGWYNTDHLKEVEGSAEYRLTPKNGDYPKPSAIKTRGYGFKIPECADIKTIHVRDAHWNATVSTEKAYPRVDIVKHEVMANNTSVVSHSNKTYYKEGAYVTYNLNGSRLTPKQVNNNSNFGLNISFGANKNSNKGRFYLKIAQIDVEYEVPSYKINGILRNNEAELNKVFDVEFNIMNENKTSHNPNITIDLPGDVQFLGKKEGDGTVVESGSTLKWDAQINNTVRNRRIVLSFMSNALGTKEFLLHAKTTDQHIIVNNTFTVDIAKDIVDIGFSSEIPTKYDARKEFKFEIDYNASNIMSDKCSIFFETKSAELKNYISKGNSTNIRFNDLGNVIELDLNVSLGRTGKIELIINHSSEDSIPLKIHYVQMENGVIKKQKIFFDETIAFIDKEMLRGIFYKLNDTQLSRMGNEVTYEISSYIWNTRPEETHDLGYNLRLGIYNYLMPPDLEDEEVLKIISDSPFLIQCPDEQFPNDPDLKTPFNHIEQKVHFQYDDNFPVYIVFFLDYSCTAEQIQISSPTIIEFSEKENNDPACEFPALNQIAGINYEIPAGKDTNALRLYDFELGEDEEDEYIVGFLMRYLFNYNIDEEHPNVGLTVLLGELFIDDEDEYPYPQSIIWGEETDDDDRIETYFWKELGGVLNKWNLDSNSRKVSNLDDLYFDFYFLNQGIRPINFSIDDFEFIANVTEPSDDNIRIKINDEDLISYGAHVSNIKLPFGVKTDNKYIEELITDKHTPYLMTIDKNEVEIEFSVTGCNLEENTKMLNEIGHLFNSKRNSMNRPEIKTLEISYLPGKVFRFITEDSIDAELNITNYNCKQKLILVDGTYESFNPTLTLGHGFNNGVSNIKPLLILTDLKPLAGSEYFFQVMEENDMYYFIINNFYELMLDKAEEMYGARDDTTAKELLALCDLFIDCERRECYLKIRDEFLEETAGPIFDDDTRDNIIDILQYVDYSSEWFSLKKEYNFIISSDNARIKQVSFYERG